MLGGPLQVLLQAQLAPDLVTSSGTQSFSPPSSVYHSFDLQQLSSQWC